MIIKTRRFFAKHFLWFCKGKFWTLYLRRGRYYFWEIIEFYYINFCLCSILDLWVSPAIIARNIKSRRENVCVCLGGGGGGSSMDSASHSMSRCRTLTLVTWWWDEIGSHLTWVNYVIVEMVSARQASPREFVIVSYS